MQLWNCDVRWDSDRDYRDGCINIVCISFGCGFGLQVVMCLVS